MAQRAAKSNISQRNGEEMLYLPALFVETHLVLCIEKLSGTVS